MNLRTELKRRHRLASKPDAKISVRWDRIVGLIVLIPTAAMGLYVLGEWVNAL